MTDFQRLILPNEAIDLVRDFGRQNAPIVGGCKLFLSLDDIGGWDSSLEDSNRAIIRLEKFGNDLSCLAFSHLLDSNKRDTSIVEVQIHKAFLEGCFSRLTVNR